MINIDDQYDAIQAYTRGRKEKIWFLKDGVKYLYKFGTSNYEIYAELIAEQLGRQCGINMASYRLAKYKDTIGILSKNFIKPGELIISSDKLKKAVQSIYEENNLSGDLKENTISNLLEVAVTYDSSVNTRKLFFELSKRWMFYGLIMESDKNETNISFIRKKTRISLSPDYDNSTMSRMNENIMNFVDRLATSGSVYQITDPIKQSLKPNDDSSDNFLDSFRQFCNIYPNDSEEIFKAFSNINVDMAITRVEKENRIEVPWEVKYFLNKTINSRYADMNMIINQDKKRR